MGGSSETEPASSLDVGTQKDRDPDEHTPHPQFDFNRWGDRGYAPIVAVDSQTAEDREQASLFLESALTRSWKPRNEASLWLRVARELNRLSWVFPHLYEKTLEHLGLDATAWRESRAFITARLSEGELEERRRGIWPSPEE